MIPARPALRKDLQIIPYLDGEGRFRYLLNHQERDEIFEFGEEEHFLCEQFDGIQEIPAIRNAFAARFGADLSMESLEAFIRYLDSLGFLVQSSSEEDWASLDEEKIYRLCNPDKLLSALTGFFGWCFSRAALTIVIVLAMFAFGVMVKYGGDFFYSLRFISKEEMILAIPFFWIVFINPLSEIAKALSCRFHGGHVYEFCLSFVYGIVPHFFSNVSDVIWMMDKKARMRALRSGLVFQLFLMSVGILCWKNVSPATPLQTFFVIFTLAAAANFFFNALPFLKKDGYFLFASYFGKGNLWERARKFARTWVLRRPSPEPLTPNERRWFKWFGIFAYIVPYSITFTLLGLAGYQLMSRLKGLGAFLFGVLLILRFGRFFRSWFRKLQSGFPMLPVVGNQTGGIRVSRLIWIGALLAFAVVCLLPYPYEVGGDFRIVPAYQYGIRVQAAGEIEKVFVREGQFVTKGQPLAKIWERDHRMKAEAAQAGVDDLRARLNLLKEGNKPEQIAFAEQQVSAAAESYRYSSAQAERYEKMYKNKAVSAEELENIQRARDLDHERLELARRNLALQKSGPRNSEIQALEAELRRQEILLAHAEEDLDLTAISSPADGRVITPNIEQMVGQRLMEGDLLMVVESTSLLAEVEIAEDYIGDVKIGAISTFRTWSDPLNSFHGKVIEIAPVAYDKSIKRVRRALSLQEQAIEQREILRDRGKAVRLLCEIDVPEEMVLKTDMTGWAKIESSARPVGISFTRWLMRFLFVEVWSWIP